jgi:autotransporter strand-loop-strand O-heptosyltransferase
MLDSIDNSIPEDKAATPVSTTGSGLRGTVYPAAASAPTQNAASGVRFDFNNGARVALPAREVGKWRVLLRDLDTGNIIYDVENRGATVRSSKKWFVRFSIDVWSLDEDGHATSVLRHEYDARDRDVLIHFPVGTLGDILAWFPYAARFAEVHGCRVTCTMSPLLIPLLRDAYPHIRFLAPGDAAEQTVAESAYATYLMGLFFEDADCQFQPTEFRQVGLHRTAAYILGVNPQEQAPHLVLPDETRPIEGPYVCIGVQSSSQAKYWNNPEGWRRVIAYLKSIGYRVICIDQKPAHGKGFIWNQIPHGAEDETGDRPLTERARWLRHAAAFIGLSSGLSWLAWAAGVPVVLISGFTHPTNEFETPYRAINWHACNSCWNDVRHQFDHKDFLWCPRHGGTDRQFECTRLITPDQVIGILKRVTTLPAIQPAA